MSNTDAYRLSLIRDSLIGVSYHLPNPEVLLFPFLDNLLLLHQAPLVFAFWRDDRVVYSTLKDPDFLGRHSVVWAATPQMRVSVPGTPYSLSIHDFRTPDTTDAASITLPVHEQATQLTRMLLAKSSDYPLPDTFYKALHKAIDAHLDSDPHVAESALAAPPPTWQEMDYRGEVLKLLEPMRAVLDEVFEEPFRAQHLTIPNGTLTYPNIFAVVRTCPHLPRYNGNFPYTAGLLLSTPMRQALSKWCATVCLREVAQPKGTCSLKFTDPNDCARALEEPLGPHSRSVSDLVFSSGIADFGRQASESGWDVADDPGDIRRQTVERCIYPHNWHLFYIPIHVGGTPWLCSFTLTKDDPSTNVHAWHHNYSLYRDLIQKTAELIRNRSHEVYSQLVAEAVVRHMRAWVTPKDEVVTKINRDAQKLAQVYPFPMLRLESEPETAERLHVSGRGAFGVTFIENPFFPEHVSWKRGNTTSILRRCRREVQEFTDVERVMELNATAHTSHLLKVPLRVLDSIASNSPQQHDHLRRQIRKVLNLHDFAASLVSEKGRSKFRQQYRRDESVEELNRLVEQQYGESVAFLQEVAVSGNLAPRLRALSGARAITLVSTCPSDIQQSRVVFFEPMLGTLFDGLLPNAIEAIDEAAPAIQVRLRAEVRNGTTGVYMDVENTTDLSTRRIDILLQRLNSPGPDFVGVTEIHWVCKACWPHVPDADRLRWYKHTRDGRTYIAASALIGEVQQ